MPPTICRLLCVDDNHDTRWMLETLLGTRGYEVKAVERVGEALSLAQAEHFDLFILDGRYPDGSGVELCRQLRRVRPETPVIFYSGAAYEGDIEQALGAGAEAYVTKPAISEFIETVRRVAGERCQAAQA